MLQRKEQDDSLQNDSLQDDSLQDKYYSLQDDSLQDRAWIQFAKSKKCDFVNLNDI